MKAAGLIGESVFPIVASYLKRETGKKLKFPRAVTGLTDFWGGSSTVSSSMVLGFGVQAFRNQIKRAKPKTWRWMINMSEADPNVLNAGRGRSPTEYGVVDRDSALLACR